MFKIKFNNPNEEFCLGIYCHKVEKITLNEDEEEISNENMQRIVIGFLLFSIDIIW